MENKRVFALTVFAVGLAVGVVFGSQYNQNSSQPVLVREIHERVMVPVVVPVVVKISYDYWTQSVVVEVGTCPETWTNPGVEIPFYQPFHQPWDTSVGNQVL